MILDWGELKVDLGLLSISNEKPKPNVELKMEEYELAELLPLGHLSRAFGLPFPGRAKA